VLCALLQTFGSGSQEGKYICRGYLLCFPVLEISLKIPEQVLIILEGLGFQVRLLVLKMLFNGFFDLHDSPSFLI